MLPTTVAFGTEGRTFSATVLRVADPRSETTRKKQCDLWAFVWTSGAVAADILWAASAHFDFRGIQVLELGAGLGLPSLVACHGCGAVVTATDLVGDSLDLLLKNSADLESKASGSLRAVKLDWNRSPSSATFAEASGGGCTKDCAGSTCCDINGPVHADCMVDVVVGADVLFLQSTMRPVLVTAFRLLKPKGVLFLVDPGRPTSELLEDEAASAGFVLVSSRTEEGVATPIGLCMAKCCVFVFQKPGADAALSEASDASSSDSSLDGLVPSLLLGIDEAVRIDTSPSSPSRVPRGYTL